MPTPAEIDAAEHTLMHDNPFLTPREMTTKMLEAAEAVRQAEAFARTVDHEEEQ